MTESVNLEVFYEEFLFTSDTPREEHQIESDRLIVGGGEHEDIITDASIILQALTPPSPVQIHCSPAENDSFVELVSQEIEYLRTTLPASENSPPNFQSEISPGYSSSGYCSAATMCDSSEMSGGSPNIVITGSGSCHQGKQIQLENNNSSNQNFPSQGGQHSSGSALSQLLGHCSNLNSALDSQHAHSQQPTHSIPQIHQQPSHFQTHLQQQQQHPAPMLDNHHHNLSQQLNLSQSQQHSSHGQSHGAHFTHGPTPQQFMPFGMHMNSGNFGNNNPYPFHPHPMSNPPPSIPHPMMNMNPMQQACFMQHAACVQMQQQQQQQHQQSYAFANSSRDRVNNSTGGAPNVGWMTGPIASNGNSGPSCVNRGPSSSCATSANAIPKSATMTVQTPVVTDPNALPGGLEVLWRELPAECQKLMVSQDIPETARFRGYFTVCELLALKRILEARFLGYKPSNGSVMSPIPVPITPNKNAFAAEASVPSAPTKEDGKRGTKRGRESKDQKTPASKSGRWSAKQTSQRNFGARNGEKESTPQEQEDNDDGNNQVGELMVSMDSLKSEQIQTSYPPAVGLGGAVKAAMDALSAAEHSSGNNMGEKTRRRNEKGNTQEGEKKGADDGCQVAPESSTTAENEQCVSTEVSHVAAEVEIETEIMEQHKANNNYNVNSSASASPQFASKGKDISRLLSPEIQEVSTLNPSEEDPKSVERQGDFNSQPYINSTTNSSVNVGVSMMEMASSMSPMIRSNYCSPPVENRYALASPPYRTSTLVLKLLRIGQYNIRTFSTVNPNRLRVLFNAQRLTYECQLPIVMQPPTEASPMPQPVRKVLTIDIGFEQISMLRFGPECLVMRVEGPPLLCVTLNQAQDEGNPPNITPENEVLLEQIEKGSLKLSPIHEVYFLNERLVHQLESQLKEHPKFRHLF